MDTVLVVATSLTHNSLPEDYPHPEGHNNQTVPTPEFRPLAKKVSNANLATAEHVALLPLRSHHLDLAERFSVTGAPGYSRSHAMFWRAAPT